MASYRYERDIDPEEVLPNAPRQYTRRERWANWWDYNLKWVIIIGLIAGFFAYTFIGQYFFTPKADYNVAVVSPYFLPQDTVSALEQQLALYGEDLNGDGKTTVTLNVYTVDFGASAENETDAYLSMAGTTKLTADIQGALSAVYILYDPAGFEQNTGSLRYLDSGLPASGSDGDWWNMVYRWTDCPVLAGLELGDYGPDSTQNYSGNSQDYMSQYYVGLRGAWDAASAESIADGETLWQALIQGAVSTAAPEG